MHVVATAFGRRQFIWPRQLRREAEDTGPRASNPWISDPASSNICRSIRLLKRDYLRKTISVIPSSEGHLRETICGGGAHRLCPTHFRSAREETGF
jgi:hypothetical protein